ncbi:MarR family winged helix-turn-helix transcriptional regulator [Sediminibacillus halophilus]|uniref:DNA-binding transcriptional regulator, MarR family n=1 Tax=Sediminibacillus halophilus TaxID=482461 RepID=A0A1G9X2K4_9BACI|nr:MarR family transcriptional regulator [Sediminibacillus halophilus]SDM90927.1 DNA-binding transcriptional regulator, MarR family [Sediminibacillus halophilus]
MKKDRKPIHLLKQKVRYLNKQMDERLREYGLFHSQWSILFCLYHNGPMTLTAIWQYLHVEAPTVTRTIKRLESKGWVYRRQGQDKREKIIGIAEDAFDMVVEVAEMIEAFEDEMLNGLSKEQQNELFQLLMLIGNKE